MTPTRCSTTTASSSALVRRLWWPLSSVWTLIVSLRCHVTVLAAAQVPPSARPLWVRSSPPPPLCRRPSLASWPQTTSPCPAASCLPWTPRTLASAARSRRTRPRYKYLRMRQITSSSTFPTLVPELLQESSQLSSKHLCSRKSDQRETNNWNWLLMPQNKVVA